jgi:cation:H+ antiporter
MILYFCLLIIGFGIIMKAANLLVDGAVCIAQRHAISPLIIGLTLVAFGTSIPEIMVSVMAAIQEKSDLALGNVIGSNIANIGFVLGFTYLIHPLQLKSTIIRQEFKPLFVAMIVTTLLMLNGVLSRLDGVVFIISLCLLLLYLGIKAERTKNGLLQEASEEFTQTITHPWVRIMIGLLLLPISAELIVFSSIEIARFFGVSEVMIGLTIVAFGTSLPELATSLSSALKGHDDMAIGNIIGSNMFNLLAVMPFIVLVHPQKVPALILTRDMPIMFFMTGLLFCITYARKKNISQLSGVILIGCYIAYLVLLGFQQ